MGHGKFGAAINCMDGRVQEPVAKWMKEKFGVDYVDTITEPGPDGIIANNDAARIEAIKQRLDISLNKHGSRVVVVAGHYDCAGNPVEREGHIADIKKSVEAIRAWGIDAEVRGLWVNSDWQVEEVE